MRTRNTKLIDYGLTLEESRKIREWCKKSDFTENILLLECAQKAHAYIFNDVYFSLVKGLSFEKLDQRVYQDYAKCDFYAYQRKTLALFRDALVKCHRYPFMTMV